MKIQNKRIKPISLFVIAFIVVMSMTHTLSSQMIFSKVDINPSGHSFPGNFTQIGNLVFFTAYHSNYGTELWVTDGTNQGTTMVKDIYLGPNSSIPAYLTSMNGKLYFLANHPSYGNELWESDGTESGTKIVMDLNPGASSSNPLVNGSAVYNSYLYFRAYHPQTGYELWRTNGSGIELSMDVYPGVTAGVASIFGELNGYLLFSSNHPNYGIELWRTDGTVQGTELVSDLWVGGSSSNPKFMTFHNGHGYFNAHDGINGFELFVTDGQSSGTQLVKDINQGGGSGDPFNLFVHSDGKLYFSAIHSNYGRELWVSDFTSAGTQMLKDIFPGNGSPNINDLLSYNGNLYFVANDGQSGEELWRTNGTTAGTQLFKDLKTGPSSSNPFSAVVYNDHLVFAADGNPNNSYTELWMTDEDTSMTMKLAPIISPTPDPSPNLLFPFMGKLLIRAEFDTDGIELWVMESNDPNGLNLNQIAPIAIYPNPSNDIVNVEHDLSEDVMLTITDISGKEMQQVQLSGKKQAIDISDYANGTYIMTLQAKGVIQVSQIVKK